MDHEEPDTIQLRRRPRSIAPYLVLAAALYGLIQAYVVLAPILLSFILILLITLAVNPLVARLRTWTGGRAGATGLMVAALLALGAIAIWTTSVPLKRSVETLSEKLPAYWERLQKPLIKIEQQAVISEEKLQEEVSAEIARESPGTGDMGPFPETPQSPPPEPPQEEDESGKPATGEGALRSNLGEMVEGVFGHLQGLAINTTEMLVVLITVFFGVAFTLANPRPIFAGLLSLVPERHHARALAITVRISRFVPLWAGSVVISMLTIGTLFFLLMWPIFGFGDAIMLGVIACLFSAIPFLGPILSLIPALLLAMGEGGMTPMWVLLAYLAVQALESNLILPLIMSRGMKLHPLYVIFSMLLCVAAFGVLGVLIAAPLVAIVGILHEALYRKHFLPTVTDDDLDRLARGALLEKRAG